MEEIIDLLFPRGRYGGRKISTLGWMSLIVISLLVVSCFGVLYIQASDFLLFYLAEREATKIAREAQRISTEGKKTPSPTPAPVVEVIPTATPTLEVIPTATPTLEVIPTATPTKEREEEKPTPIPWEERREGASVVLSMEEPQDLPESWEVWPVIDEIGRTMYDAPRWVHEKVARDYMRLYSIFMPETLEGYEPPPELEEVYIVDFDYRFLFIMTFSEDGMGCTIYDVRGEGKGKIYSLPDKKFLREEHYPPKFLATRMRYDQKEKIWKIREVFSEGGGFLPIEYLVATKKYVMIVD